MGTELVRGVSGLRRTQPEIPNTEPRSAVRANKWAEKRLPDLYTPYADRGRRGGFIALRGNRLPPTSKKGKRRLRVRTTKGREKRSADRTERHSQRKHAPSSGQTSHGRKVPDQLEEQRREQQCSVEGVEVRHQARSSGQEVILSMYLAAHPEVLASAETILELGSGSGLVGIAAAKLCGQPGKVVMTDHNENVLELLQENIDSNFEEGEERPTCEFLDWCMGVERFKKRYGTFDVVLGADIVYSERTIMPMLSTARTLLAEKPSSVFLLVYVGRLKVYDEMFRECSSECQLHCTEVKLDSIPGAADIQDDSAMLHKIRVIVLRHKAFLDRSLDLLVAETLERVRTVEVEDTADSEGAAIKNPGPSDVVADESTEYDRFPISDHSSTPQFSEPKDPSTISDENDEHTPFIDETENPSDCNVIVPLKHIATEALVDAAEDRLPAESNCNVMEDNGEVAHNFGTDSVGGNSLDESSAKKDNDLSGLPGTDEGGETPTVTAPTGGRSSTHAGTDIPTDDREMKSQRKERISVIPTVMAASEAEEKPPIVNGALTAAELPSIQVTSTEDVVCLISDVETEKYVVEGSDRANVDDLTPMSEEPYEANLVVGSGLKDLPDLASNSDDTIEAVVVADRVDDVPNEAGLDVDIYTGKPPVTATVHCDARDRTSTKFNQESTSMTKSENCRKSDDDMSMSKIQPLDEEVSGIETEASLFGPSKSLESTQGGDRKLKSFDETTLLEDVGSMQLCSVSGGDDEIIYHVGDGENETRFDTDKKIRMVMLQKNNSRQCQMMALIKTMKRQP
ncbi:hypothetical protein Bbelb_034530 [Branchiostoma belcheri]|nr:hypothetical protein Bbelb_034530 [Branchiostoma belcheri]